MDLQTRKKIFAATFVVAVLIGFAFIAYRVFVKPAEEADILAKTSAAPLGVECKKTYTVALDSFIGYFVFRDPVFHRELAKDGICLNLVDDAADYTARHKGLKGGKYQLALFELSAYIKAGALAGGEFPATAVMVVDETADADCIITYKDAVNTFDDLNVDGGRFVVTPDSPAEFFARIVYNSLNFTLMGDKWMVGKDGAEAVYKQFKADEGQGLKRAYVMWEPYCSIALENPGAKLIMGSSKLEGMILDLLMANRQFMAEHSDDIVLIVKAYMRTLHSYMTRQDALIKALMADAERTNTKNFTRKHAADIAGRETIRWKRVLDNHRALGIKGQPTLLASITRITEVLEQTQAIRSGAVSGKQRTLFAPGVFRELDQTNFRPGGGGKSLVKGIQAADLKKAHTRAPVKELTPQQWEQLGPVGSMDVPNISFLRGSNRLTTSGEGVLDELSERLASMPGYYVLVTGHTRKGGNAAKARELELDRATAAVEYLMAKGVARARLQATASKPTGNDSGGQSVSFQVLQEVF